MKLTKAILIIAPILIIIFGYKKSEVKEALNGKWQLHFQEDHLNTDTILVQELKIKNYQVTETIYLRVGRTRIGKKAKKKGSYKFVESFSKDTLKIEFNGGIFIDQEDYYISKITPDTIYLLSYHKHGEDTRYLIKK